MERHQLFSNGTEFMLWQARNCEKCVKAVWFNEEKRFLPKYRCMVQKHIEEAAVTDGMGSKRDYDATHSYWCPYKSTERKRYPKKVKENKNKVELFNTK